MSFGVAYCEYPGVPGGALVARSRLLNQVFASSTVLRRMSKPVPWKALVPELVVKLRMPPVVRSYCAGGVAVVTLYSRMASTEGAVSSKVELLSGRCADVPSSRTSSPKFWPPLVFWM